MATNHDYVHSFIKFKWTLIKLFATPAHSESSYIALNLKWFPRTRASFDVEWDFVERNRPDSIPNI